MASFPQITIAVLTIEREKVAVQDRPDALQQDGVDSLPFKDIIHVCPVTMQLLGKPRRAASLSTQLSLNFIPNMNHLYCCFIAATGITGSDLDSTLLPRVDTLDDDVSFNSVHTQAIARACAVIHDAKRT